MHLFFFAFNVLKNHDPQTAKQHRLFWINLFSGSAAGDLTYGRKGAGNKFFAAYVAGWAGCSTFLGELSISFNYYAFDIWAQGFFYVGFSVVLVSGYIVTGFAEKNR